MVTAFTKPSPTSLRVTARPRIGVTPSVARKLSLAETAVTASMWSGEVRLPAIR